MGTPVPSSYHTMGAFSSATTHSVVAPFAADVDTNFGGSVSYQEYSSPTDASLVSQVSTFIRSSQSTYFAGTWMFVAYWNHVPLYRGSLVSWEYEYRYSDYGLLVSDLYGDTYSEVLFVSLPVDCHKFLPSCPNHWWDHLLCSVLLQLQWYGVGTQCHHWLAGWQLLLP